MANTTETLATAKTLLDYAEQLGPTIVGLAALWITYVTVSRQIRAATISTSRQQWINSLQEAMSRYLAAVAAMSSMMHGETADANKVWTKGFALQSASATVSIMLNMDNADHRELRRRMKEFLRICRVGNQEPDDGTNQSPRAEARDALITAAQKVMNAEWSKIKQGK